ncbi:FAD-dependent oxidoreductase [Micractinium conductrix]|uniref:FAD-dependent oxidoreductase domain-containing protein 1 n=1 Tax=Micractinium conductrix TaxID=554055 RepID=A0A2P6V1L7_9CHLO|nr:FAD-dependent oxidoreductase [Micractinium conductrix]|eukprot:PSC67997.1 FAD-dependent oxidoreductase [Micractinium conductrix]
MDAAERPATGVVLLDRNEPCAGATGAGQGYLWLAHRDPSSPAWQLAMGSKAMWPQLLAPVVPELTAEAVEWQSIGSVLIATDAEETEALHRRAALLQRAGLDARCLPAADVPQLEPALALGADGSALLVPSDAQVNGRAAAAALLRACQAHGARFCALFQEDAAALDQGPSGRVTAVRSEARRIAATRGVVVALGAWTGGFLAAQLPESAAHWEGAFRPRRGLLLEMPRPADMPQVEHGLMEMGYSKHYSSSTALSGSSSSTSSSSSTTTSESGDPADITFTATTSASGTLLVGSSREFAWCDGAAPEAVVEAIMQRAAVFLPGLGAVQRSDISVRAGPRPYATAGAPMVGPVPGAAGVVVAAGHEGSGLTLAPATAELVCDYLLGRQPALEAAAVDMLRVPFC